MRTPTAISSGTLPTNSPSSNDRRAQGIRLCGRTTFTTTVETGSKRSSIRPAAYKRSLYRLHIFGFEMCSNRFITVHFRVSIQPCPKSITVFLRRVAGKSKLVPPWLPLTASTFSAFALSMSEAMQGRRKMRRPHNPK